MEVRCSNLVFARRSREEVIEARVAQAGFAARQIRGQVAADAPAAPQHRSTGSVMGIRRHAPLLLGTSLQRRSAAPRLRYVGSYILSTNFSTLHTSASRGGLAVLGCQQPPLAAPTGIAQRYQCEIRSYRHEYSS